MQARQTAVVSALREAFGHAIETRTVEVIVFSRVGVMELAAALMSHPEVLKPLAAVCGIAARAIERDLGLRNLDTYLPRLREPQATAIAGYIKPFLPPCVEVPALVQVDRAAFVDKEIRRVKGQWERLVLQAVNESAAGEFRKRRFQAGDREQFELDAAWPQTGPVQVGVDIKRIEARRDIHKRCDEIVNKAARLRQAYPQARFGVVIYYPFVSEHVNVQSRLQSPHIEAVVFAAESKESVTTAVKLLLSRLGVP